MLGDFEVCQKLKPVGLELKSIYDLVNTKISYPLAIAPLLEMIPEVKDKIILEGIIRALCIKEAANKAEPTLIQLFLTLKPHDEFANIKWTIGHVLNYYGTIDNHFAQINSIVKDSNHDGARQMLVLLLAKTKLQKEMAVDTCLSLLNDESVRGHAITALDNLKAQSA